MPITKSDHHERNGVPNCRERSFHYYQLPARDRTEK